MPIRDVAVRPGIVGELPAFPWERRRWWMIPMVPMLPALGTLPAFARGSAAAPFVYTLL